VEEIKANPGDTLRCLCWTADGKSFYSLEKSGVLRRIALDGLKETLRSNLGAACSWMSPSAEGLLVAVSGLQEVWVLDPMTFQAKKKIPVPSLDRVASAPGLSVAFASGSGLSVLDLKSGQVVKQYMGREFPAKFIGLAWPTVTPDGKYLFTAGGIEQLHRFRIEGQNLVYEQSSPRIAQNGQCIELSPDSKYVCLPSGGGNYGASPSYSTFIYSVKNIETAALTIPGGAYPRAMGFDPKRGTIYAQNHGSSLIIFTDKGIKQKEYAIPGAGEVRQILSHPDGGKVLLLTNQLNLVTLKSS